MKELFRTQKVSEIQSELDSQNSSGRPALKRHLGSGNLVLLGIGCVIGAGIFSLTGSAAANYAGPGVVFSFMIAGFACAMAGLCYAEFASMVPSAGSAYTYTYATMGELLAWIIGWDLILEYGVASAAVASSWSAYLMKFLAQVGIAFPLALAASPFTVIETLPNGTTVHGIVNLPAIFIVCAVSMLLIRGIKESTTFNAVMVAIKLTVVVGFIALGWHYMNPANHIPFVPPNTGNFGEFGWSGVFRGAAVIFFAYIGFDAVSTAAQEARNPRRDLPIGILGSLFICTLLYCLFSYVLTGLASYKQFIGLNQLAPIAKAIENTPYQSAILFVEVAILCGFSSVIMILLLGQSRVFYSMSRDGLLPKMFSEIHPLFRTPWKSNILFCGFVSLFAGLVPGKMIGEMTSIGTLFAFVIVCISVCVLRHTQPGLKRTFRTPWVPLVPLLGITSCLAMMLSLPWETWIRLAVWMGIGLLIYFFYSASRSRLNRP